MRSPLVYIGIIYTNYLLIGGIVFYLLENVHFIPMEEYFPNIEQEYDDMIQILNDSDTVFMSDVEYIMKWYKHNRPQIPYQKIEADEPTWDFDTSLFFSVGLVTTIGYGNVAPQSSVGQIFCIVFMVFGIPLNIVLMRTLAEVHSERWQKLFRDPVMKAIESKFMQRVFIFQDLLYAIGGIIFIPTIILMYSESWSFLEGLYYSIITLSTVGFGDYVAGGQLEEAKFTTLLYRLFLFIWFVCGVSYLIMLFAYMAHYNTIHFTYAFVCRNKKPGFVRLRFAFAKENFHNVLYGTDEVIAVRSETPTVDTEYLSSIRSIEDMDTTIIRMIRERKMKLQELQKRRVILKEWKAARAKRKQKT